MKTLNIEKLENFVRDEIDGPVDLKNIVHLAEYVTEGVLDVMDEKERSAYLELKAISEQISATRKELAEFRVEEMHEEQIPLAGRELDAVVVATESATETIMEAAEEIMAGDQSDPDAFMALVNDKVMEIFEACSFQDITGQRIAKVTSTLDDIDRRIRAVLGGLKPDDLPVCKKDERPDADLLNGPAFEGEGVNQADIDSLFE